MGSGLWRSRLIVVAGLLLLGLAPVSAPHRALGVDRMAPAARSNLSPSESASRALAGAGAHKPNIIVFLADDMWSQLLRHMPNTRRLIFGQGATFTNYYTNISLCCPSRASMFTGKYAHNTGIHGNLFPDGFYGFHVGPERWQTVPVTLARRAGYRTALLGKYFNEYPFVESRPQFGVRPTFVPHGWSDWAVPIRGQYAGTDYRLNLNGRIVHKDATRDYLGDFLTRRALWLIRNNHDRTGLAMFLSYYGPHSPEPASPTEKRNRALVQRISRMHVPRTPDYNERDVSDKPRQMRRLRPLGPGVRARLDAIYRREVLSVTSIDRYVSMVVRELRRTGQLARTYLVFTSDNGLHLGSHRLVNGKNSPYEIDARVPFAIRGPGIAPGTVVRKVAANIDIAPTLAQMAGSELSYRHDGESLLPLARGRIPEWRHYFLVTRGFPFSGSARLSEFTRELERRSAAAAGRVPYRAAISSAWQYIRYGNGAEELYDGRRDPYQVRNVLARPPGERTPQEQRALLAHRGAVLRLTGCAGVNQCRVQ
jgi:arylsulfatase A-like enzyme